MAATATATGSTKGYIYRCKVCDAVRRVDYPKMTETHPGPGGYPRSVTFVLVNGIKMRSPGLSGPTCCGKRMVGKAVKGRTTDHECDERCMGATGPQCECSCGGANHGSAHTGG